MAWRHRARKLAVHESIDPVNVGTEMERGFDILHDVAMHDN